MWDVDFSVVFVLGTYSICSSVLGDALSVLKVQGQAAPQVCAGEGASSRFRWKQHQGQVWPPILK